MGLVVQQSYGGWTISCLENRKFSGEWVKNFERSSRSGLVNVRVLFARVKGDNAVTSMYTEDTELGEKLMQRIM